MQTITTKASKNDCLSQIYQSTTTSALFKNKLRGILM